MIMRLSSFLMAAIAISCAIDDVAAWAPSSASSRLVSVRQHQHKQHQHQHQQQQQRTSISFSNHGNALTNTLQSHRQERTRLWSSEDTTSSTTEEASSASFLTDNEWDTIKALHDKAQQEDGTSLTDSVLQALPTFEPALVMKLRQLGEDSTLDDRPESIAIAGAVNVIMDERLNEARDILQDLLGAGEIRKLDSLIGKYARGGKLDVAFFQVLNMNLQDASKSMEEAGGGDSDDGDNPLQNAGANRFQILKHIYTRCQEEVEKTIPAGVALLNKLLRTEQAPIRSNQLQHYLCPQPNTITTPDGKELELDGPGPILVAHTDFVDAIGNAVKQIRTIEKGGGASSEVTAGLVESCRTVAKEARIVIGENFGVESEELIAFEDGLMPVFRPSSSDSPYIQGE